MSDWKLSHSLGLLVYLPTWWQLCVGWVRFIRRNSNLAPIIPTCHKNSRTLPSYFHQFVFTTGDTLIIATMQWRWRSMRLFSLLSFDILRFSISHVVYNKCCGEYCSKLISIVVHSVRLCLIVSKWQGCIMLIFYWTFTRASMQEPIRLLSCLKFLLRKDDQLGGHRGWRPDT